MDTVTHAGNWRVARGVLVVMLSVIIVTMLFRLTEAGSLTPSAPPAPSSESFENIYSVLVSTGITGFNSSSINPSKNGSALQITKCIMQRMTGGALCP